jgi:hypothetical protein
MNLSVTPKKNYIDCIILKHSTPLKSEMKKPHIKYIPNKAEPNNFLIYNKKNKFRGLNIKIKKKNKI